MEVSLRTYGRLFVTTLLLAALSFWSGNHSGGAAASTASPCSPSTVTLSAAPAQSQFSLGTTVHITVALHNRSELTCSFSTGPFSPNFVLTNSHGRTVWGSCWYGGGPAPCADNLLRRTLGPGVTYLDRLTWDERTGHPERFVPAGRYTFRVNFAGLNLGATASFDLTSSRSLNVTLADSGGHFNLAVGGLLSLRLVPSILVWSAAVSSTPNVVAAVPEANPVAGLFVFRALSTGTARVSTTGNPACYPQCLMPSRLFYVTVKVVAP